jgi:hypothetical protein
MKKRKKIKQKNSVLESELYDSLTSISFDFKGKRYEVDIGGELLVEEEDLHSQVERIPAVLGYVGSIVTKLEREYRDKKALLKKIEAQIDKKIRETGIVGETRILKAIHRHPKWIESCIEVNKAGENAAKASRLWVSLKEKAIILLSRSSDIRNIPSDSIRGVLREEVIGLKGDFGNQNYDDDDDDND